MASELITIHGTDEAFAQMAALLPQPVSGVFATRKDVFPEGDPLRNMVIGQFSGYADMVVDAALRSNATVIRPA